jgi:hypothetical protein
MNILFERIRDIFTKNLRAYLILNALYYGILIVFMIYLNFDPTLRDAFVERYNTTFLRGAPELAGKPFEFRQTLGTVFGTFNLNLLGSSYGEITFPSLIIPFAGVAIGLYRVAFIGMAFSPANPTAAGIFLPHLPTLLLEGQAAILAMLGAYVHGRALIWPKTIGQKSRWKAFVEGVRQSGMMYLPITGVLLVAALYGFIEIALIAGR